MKLETVDDGDAKLKNYLDYLLDSVNELIIKSYSVSDFDD